MSTNQEIWGESTNWTCPVSGMTGSNQDMKPLVGYFGEAPSNIYPAGCLYNGIYHDVFPTINGNMFTDEPIDNSISYCGLGNESVWSRVQYYMCGPNTTQSLTASDNRSVTNFAFCNSQGIATGLYQNNNSDTNQKRGNRDRWCPMGYNLKELDPTAANTNSNRRVHPYVQLPVRNMILTATLRVASTLVEDRNSTSGMDLANVALWDYMDTTKTRNYTTHPYILGITIQPYMVGTSGADNIDPVTGVPPTSRTSINIYSGITLLSPLSYADGVESDAGNPGNILSDVYSYYWSKTPSRLTGIWIFGTSTVGLNDTEFIRQISTDEVTGQLRWALPHPYAIMRSMAQTNDYGWYYLEYYDNGGDDNLVHWIMEQMACFGLFFTIDKETAQTGALNSENMCLGILENGIGHGRWTTGEDNEDQPQWEWDTTNNSSYKPSDNPEPTPSEDSGTTSYLGAVKQSLGNGNWYVISQEDLADVKALLANINDIPQDVGEDYFFGQNAIDCVLEIKYIFVGDYTFGKIMPSGKTGIKVGKYTLNTPTAYKFNLTAPETFSSDTIYIESKNFRSFQPYTSATFVVPFCGSIEIPISSILDRYCYMEETIDPLSGDIMARLFAVSQQGSIEIASIQGNCALDAPVSGYQIAQYYQTRMQLISAQRNAMFNAAASLIGGASGGAIAANYGNPTGMVSQFLGGAVNAAAGLYNAGFAHLERQHTLPPAVEIQKYTPNVEWGKVINPCIIVISSIPHENYNDSDYAAKTGFATYKVDTIGNQSGRVVCSNVAIDGINCTPEEKQMIKQALESGVYIK